MMRRPGASKESSENGMMCSSSLEVSSLSGKMVALTMQARQVRRCPNAIHLRAILTNITVRSHLSLDHRNPRPLNPGCRSPGRLSLSLRTRNPSTRLVTCLPKNAGRGSSRTPRRAGAYQSPPPSLVWGRYSLWMRTMAISRSASFL
jgi:hypothetical protein